MDNAFTYAETTKIESETNYPYKGRKLFGSCEYEAAKGVVGVTTFADVTPNSPDQLKAALVK